jgi:hypothetical protein
VKDSGIDASVVGPMFARRELLAAPLDPEPLPSVDPELEPEDPSRIAPEEPPLESKGAPLLLPVAASRPASPGGVAVVLLPHAPHAKAPGSARPTRQRRLFMGP